jgi:hypothetical protein
MQHTLSSLYSNNNNLRQSKQMSTNTNKAQIAPSANFTHNPRKKPLANYE